MFSTKGCDVLSEKTILERISEFDIFKYYISDLEKPNTPFCSELRKDSTPTCRVSLLNKGYVYKDFGTGDTYSCFQYVQTKYGLKWFEALKVIATDFKLGLGPESNRKKAKPIVRDLLGKEPKPVKQVDMKIVPRDKLSAQDIRYWLQYNITPCILSLYKVQPISHYYLNSVVIKVPKEEMAFAYNFGNYKYKILRPTGGTYKWTNNSGGIIQGLKQLPATGETLFITSSLKDVMSLRSIGELAVAPQSENTLIDLKLVNKFKEKFKHVVLYYNNDVPGIQAAEEHAKLYDIPYIYHPEGDEKDPSDYIKENGIKHYKQLLEQLLWQIEIGLQEIISKER